MISLFKRNKEMRVNIERWEYVCVVIGVTLMSLGLIICLLWVGLGIPAAVFSTIF